MRALLIQHECEAALEVLPEDMEAQAKTELNKKAHSAMILCLGNKVLREVTGETTAAGVWSKLETLYMTKSLANKLYLKKKLYTFYMPAGRKIFEHIDEFNKIVLDLANIEVKFGDEDLALLLLTSLPALYEHFVDTLLYRPEALTLEDVMATLNLKEIKERSKEKGDDGEGLYVRGRTDRRDSRQSKGKSRSKSRSGRLKCYICQSEDHLKRNCDDGDERIGSGSARLDHGFRMFIPHDTQGCLSGIRRDNCVYSLDGHALAGELNASVEEKDSLAQVWYKRLGHNQRGGDHRGRHTTQGVIDYFHSDLWGPSQVESLGGKRYFLSIVDDYSRRTGRTVKKLRTDNGLEFCNREFEQLCIESVIARHLTVAGTPQQNRVAECMNRTLIDKGVKGYKLYRLDDESPKIVTSKNMVFNESVMYIVTLKDFGAGDKYVEELQVEVELQRLNNHTLEEDQKDQEDGDDKDVGDQETG
ncbi:retrovirus-related pol polyprotein from transposon TNT 1-94 [Tanacetum coccineum]